jgi:Starch-binding associating with outer membrane/Susd and RagB outer membrane lipoprotein
MKLKSILLILVILIGNACTLDLVKDPNAVQTNQGIPNLILNSAQRNFAVMFDGASVQGMQLSRLMNSGGSLYNDIFPPQSQDALWNNAYASILQDLDILIKDTDAKGFARHSGMARVLQAYTIALLVDYLGDVPFSKAFGGASQFNPPVDSQTELYNTAISTLDKAIQDLTTASTLSGGYLSPSAPAPDDFFYGGQFARWVRAANSMKLKMFLNLRNVDAVRATTEINALIAGGQLITAADDNFVFRYGTNQSDPDSRAPRFVAMYPSGGGNYMSNWLMWHMFWGYSATHNAGLQGDPRMRFYFYRQVSTNSADPNQIRCVATPAIPAHYPQSTGSTILLTPNAGMPPSIALRTGLPPDPASAAWSRTFCYPSNIGYWGRDHVDPQGIPPDNFQRTAWGVYPAGGRFDANVNTGVTGTVGMRGAGFQPIMMRAYIDFMLAEASLYLGTTGAARTYFQNGMGDSFDDVRNWAVNGQFGAIGVAAANESATINTFYPSATYTTDRGNYITSALAAYDAQTTSEDRMNYVAREYWIALFGNGIEAWNLYRRTGLPTGMQPAVNPAPGGFPRSLFYPAVFATRNNTVTQKTGVTTKVFWDTKATTLDF